MNNRERGGEPQAEAPAAPDDPPAWAARKLVRAARAGTLASAIDGQPFASLITPATAPDASVLMLLSDLSEHTRHLRSDARCAVMVAGEPDGPNAQTAPRVTLSGTASLEPDPALKARWVALHPYAAFYAGFGDFHLWRLRPVAGQFIGGFARAHRLQQPDLVADAPAVASAEPRVIEHCNADHADALAAIAQRAGLPAAPWRMVACDTDGFDLRHDDRVHRVHWPAAVDSPAALRSSLVELARIARSGAEP